MKNICLKPGRGNGRFRVEWDARKDGSGTLYLYGVKTFGENGERCKRFVTEGALVSVYGEDLSVLTFRSGCVEVCGRILGVSYGPERDREGERARH